MPLVNNKVGDDCTVGTDKALADGEALLQSLIKVKTLDILTFLCCFSSVTFITVFCLQVAIKYTFLKMQCQKQSVRLMVLYSY